MVFEIQGFLLVASIQDRAGCNIASVLRSRYGFKETSSRFEDDPIYKRDEHSLIYTGRCIMHTEHLEAFFKPRAYIFLSRHSSEKGVPCLTAHFPGNLGDDASHGGRAREPAVTYPSLLKCYMRDLWARRSEVEGYQIVLEPMHHGPSSLSAPCMFVEIGSRPEQWADENAASVVADALWSALERLEPAQKIGIGFGGSHYSTKFTEFLVRSEYALGAIASKHILPQLRLETARLMASRCAEKVCYAVLDWKGLSTEKKAVLRFISELGLEAVRV